MSSYINRAKRILQRIDELATISERPDGICRLYGTKEFIEGRNKVEEWMKQAGLETKVDNIGNLRGRLVASSSAGRSKVFVIASHIDTIINAGKFDGPLGVIMGIDLIEEIQRRNLQLPFDIEVVAFCDEEGCRFHTTYLGSKVLSGSFDARNLASIDEGRQSLEDIIEQNQGNCANLQDDAIGKEDWAGYLEIHIEQGPVLYERDIPVAVVSNIAGQQRLSITFKGEAGHAGTVPMNMRKDALTAASVFILEAERHAAESGIVATVGKINIPNAASNVIPGEVNFTLDIRSPDESSLSTAIQKLKETAEGLCHKRGIELQWEEVQQARPVSCDQGMIAKLRESIKDAGYELVELTSGAGHDAVPISEVSPVAMLFVRCYKGISHNPLENVELKDIAAAIQVSDNFMHRLFNS